MNLIRYWISEQFEDFTAMDVIAYASLTLSIAIFVFGLLIIFYE